MSPTSIDKRRLRDGATATALLDVPLGSMTLQQLQELREVLRDGAVALQSLDDLGSPEANDAAWQDMQAVSEKLELVNQALLARRVDS